MAKLKARLDSLDGVEESVKALYRTHEAGGFVVDLDLPDGWDLQDIRGLKSALADEKEQRRVAREERDRLAAKGEEYEKQLERYKKRKHDEPDTQKAIEEALAARDAEWNSKFEEQGRTLTSKLELRDREVYGYAVENAALAALKKAGATDEGLELLMPHVQKRLRLRRDDAERLHVDVLDGNGNPAIGARPDQPASLEDVIGGEFKKKYPSAFAGTRETGSGAPGNRGAPAGGQLTPEQAGQLSMAEFKKAMSEGRIAG